MQILNSNRSTFFCSQFGFMFIDKYICTLLWATNIPTNLDVNFFSIMQILIELHYVVLNNEILKIIYLKFMF